MKEFTKFDGIKTVSKRKNYNYTIRDQETYISAKIFAAMQAKIGFSPDQARGTTAFLDFFGKSIESISNIILESDPSLTMESARNKAEAAYREVLLSELRGSKNIELSIGDSKVIDLLSDDEAKHVFEKVKDLTSFSSLRAVIFDKKYGIDKAIVRKVIYNIEKI